MEYKFPDLPYASDALEPYLDKMTLEIHHGKHHKAYYDKFVVAIKQTTQNCEHMESVFAQISKLPIAVRNNGGGYWNHTFFWESLTPKGKVKPEGKLIDAIEKNFGSFDEFKTKFSDAAANHFGSGWAWLAVNAGGSLFICSTPNQDNPLMDIAEFKGEPILTLDLWEHAYYLKYQNRRPDYIAAFWNIINWDKVEQRYEKALK